jgi:hypothetical protein
MSEAVKVSHQEKRDEVALITNEYHCLTEGMQMYRIAMIKSTPNVVEKDLQSLMKPQIQQQPILSSPQKIVTVAKSQ